MEQVLTQIISDIKYVVCLDYISEIDMEFETDEQKNDYIARHESGELSFFSVHTFIQCECCEQWKERDSLYGIDATSAIEALNLYIA